MGRALDGMVVVITGASAGIGAALAQTLSARGARLVLAARRLDRLEALNRSLGDRHLCVRTDVARREDCEALVARAVDRFGRIDTLVCNAGYGILRPVAETTPEQMQEIFQANVFGTADCVRAAVPHMLRQEPAAPAPGEPAGRPAAGPLRRGAASETVGAWRGQVMIVSSAVARRGIPYFGAYSATKAAQLALAEAMRVELRPRRIAVTSVHPIGTDTEFGAAAERRAGGGRIGRISGEVRQSPEHVALKMARAIERPVPEVWPFVPSRWALSLATLMPRLVDRVMARRVTVERPAG
jgi:short-subunit dehydrogenase